MAFPQKYPENRSRSRSKTRSSALCDVGNKPVASHEGASQEVARPLPPYKHGRDPPWLAQKRRQIQINPLRAKYKFSVPPMLKVLIS